MSMREEKSKEVALVIAITSIFACVAFGLGLKIRYQPDLYLTIFEPNELLHHIIYDNGRVVSGLLFAIMIKLKLSYPIMFCISFWSELFFSILLTTRFSLLLIQRYKSKSGIEPCPYVVVLISLTSCITLSNVFSIEAFLYPVWFYFMMSAWLSVEAAILFIKHLDDSKRARLFAAWGILLLSTLIYQTNASIFLILCIPFILCGPQYVRKLVNSFVKLGVIYACAILPDVFYITAFTKSTRVESTNEGGSIIAAAQTYAPSGETPIQFILKRIPSALWIYSVLCILIGVVLVSISIRTKQYIELLKGPAMVVATIMIGLLPYIMKISADYKPRIYYPLGTLLGVLLIYSILNGWVVDYGLTRYICILTLCVMTLTEWVSFNNIYTIQYITDYEDRYISLMIGNEIHEYEQSTGNTIEKVCFYEDREKTKYITNSGWCLSERGYSASWSRRPVLNYYLGTNYASGEKNYDLESQFAKTNWDTFCEEQIFFVGNTVHICVY